MRGRRANNKTESCRGALLCMFVVRGATPRHFRIRSPIYLSLRMSRHRHRGRCAYVGICCYFVVKNDSIREMPRAAAAAAAAESDLQTNRLS